MREYFIKWCEENYLDINWLEYETFAIDGVGSFLLLDTGVENVVDSECYFNLNKGQVKIISTGTVENIVFLFGGEFFYAKSKLNSEGKLPFDCTPFKYLGKAKLPKGLNTPDYYTCFVHEEYELFNGSFMASDWVKKAKFLGLKHLVICGKDTLAGTLAFQVECAKKGIKSILGMTITICYDIETQKQKYIAESGDNKLTNFFPEYYEGVVIAKNNKGWRNLLRINNEINVQNVEGNGDGKSTFIFSDDLFKYGEGVVFIFNTNSILQKHTNNKPAFLRDIKLHEKHFDQCFFQFDFTRFNDPNYDLTHLNCKKFYLQHFTDKIEPILMHDSFFLEKEQNMIKNNLNEIGRIRTRFSKDFHFAAFHEYKQELKKLFDEHDDRFDTLIEHGLESLKYLHDNCNFEIEIGRHKLPKYPMKGSEDEKVEFFMKLAYDGLEEKIGFKKKYVKRLERELAVIINAGFVDYFLITWDVVKWAKTNKILVGNGRGSVCGSLLAYCLDITTVDPLKYDLLFERFINEARVSGERAKSADSLPDIDLDFEGAHRDRVKRYLESKYGQSNVCSIGTYARFKCKVVLKDFARLGGLNFQYVNNVTRTIPNAFEASFKALIDYAVKENIPVKQFLIKNPTITRKLSWIVNQAHHFSVHASAVVVVPRENEDGEKNLTIQDWMPVRKMDGKLVSEWEGKYIDRAGFLKEDVLGIAQLDKFQAILQLIKQNTGKDVVLEDIPFDDEEVFRYFKKGWNEDVFQFGSEGLKSYCRLVKPDTLEELIAMNALFRPGPMSSNAHKLFADIKHGKAEPEYDFGLKEVTENTFGLYIYQEQIMRAVHVLGGLTLVEADEVRTVMKKKDPIQMYKYKSKFIQGASDKGCKENEAEKIWTKLEAFSGYGFNKSHAAAYSIMGYWCQWLKVYHPLEYWTVSFNMASEKEIPYRLSEFNKLDLGIKLMPPDINKSAIKFTCDAQRQVIYYSLTKIKGIAEASVEDILAQRNVNGDYENIIDFVNRVTKSKVNKAKIQNLILAGAFDGIEGISEPLDRRSLLQRYFTIIKHKEDNLPNEEHYYIQMQRALTGFGEVDYEKHVKKYETRGVKYVPHNEFFELKNPKAKYKHQIPYSIIAGRLMYLDEKMSKRGEYARVTFVNNNERLEGVFWNDVWEDLKGKLEIGAHYAVKIQISLDGFTQKNKFNSGAETQIWKLKLN